MSSLTARPEFRGAVQAASAILAIELLSHAIRLERIYWAEITAIIVVCQTCGESLRKSGARALATLLGAVLGALLCHALDSQGVGHLAHASILALSVFLALYSFPEAYGSYVFWFCLSLVLAMDMVSGRGQAMAFIRVYETSLGCVAGMAASLFILPVRARAAASAEIVSVLKATRPLLAASLERIAGRAQAPAEFEILVALRAKAGKLGKLLRALESEESFLGAQDGSMAGRIVNLRAFALQACDLYEHVSERMDEKPVTPLFTAWSDKAGGALLSDIDATVSALESKSPVSQIADLSPMIAESRADFMKALSERPELKPEAGPFLFSMHWLWTIRGSLERFVRSLPQV